MLSFARSFPLLTLAVVLLLSRPSQAGERSSKFVKVFQVSNRQQSHHLHQGLLLTSPQDVDPLASVSPLFGHSKSAHSFAMPPPHDQSHQNAQPATASTLQPNYEVNRPTRVLAEEEKLKSCTVTVATNSFANRYVIEQSLECFSASLPILVTQLLPSSSPLPFSYGTPLVVQYSPDMLDSSCNDPSKWVFIELTLSGNVSGRQFDRLGSVQLDGVEVLRTDNPEPTQRGVSWSFTKEMNKYFDLWKSKRTVVFDFPNIVNDVYTGIRE